MTQPPKPNYDYEVTRLVGAYEKAIEEILRELNRLDLNNFSRANQLATLKSIGEILNELNVEAGELARASIEKAVKDGIISAIMSLGIAETVQAAETLVKFNRINKELVAAAVADTQSDLLAVTRNVDNKVRATVRRVSAEVLRSNLTKGVNATQSLRRDITAELRKQLGESVNTGIIDAAGRRWRPSKYVNVLVRTKMMEAHKESTINEALSRDVMYGVISRHGAKDACGKWEGKVVKLTPDAPGNYVYINDIPRNELFHPCCRHTVSPIRNPERA
ncbi:phage minor capsid protein [Heyndrickxia oleronia]|uniref:phage minor capsid protein n=1 Tax=Heyndrickxia oleronia TaxID=38875 RepID=UPI001C0ED77E|nr:phage minor capsid protein [Heyndrickxia oleronia]MBU5211064.1 phage minor capsid protein [Heyndrickxia oleronia]